VRNFCYVFAAQGDRTMGNTLVLCSLYVTGTCVQYKELGTVPCPAGGTRQFCTLYDQGTGTCLQQDNTNICLDTYQFQVTDSAGTCITCGCTVHASSARLDLYSLPCRNWQTMRLAGAGTLGTLGVWLNICLVQGLERRVAVKCMVFTLTHAREHTILGWSSSYLGTFHVA